MLDKINEYILEQDGKEVTIDSKLTDSGMDSFSYCFFWAYLSEDFPEFTSEYVSEIDYNTYTIKEMIDYHEASKL